MFKINVVFTLQNKGSYNVIVAKPYSIKGRTDFFKKKSANIVLKVCQRTYFFISNLHINIILIIFLTIST